MRWLCQKAFQSRPNLKDLSVACNRLQTEQGQEQLQNTPQYSPPWTLRSHWRTVLLCVKGPKNNWQQSLGKLGCVLTGKQWLSSQCPGSSCLTAGLPAQSCTPAPRDTFRFPHQHLQEPIYTKLQLSTSEAIKKKKILIYQAADGEDVQPGELGREQLQRAALHFLAVIRTTYLFEWWWLHGNTSAEPKDDSYDVNRGEKANKLSAKR